MALYGGKRKFEGDFIWLGHGGFYRVVSGIDTRADKAGYQISIPQHCCEINVDRYLYLAL